MFLETYWSMIYLDKCWNEKSFTALPITKHKSQILSANKYNKIHSPKIR